MPPRSSAKSSWVEIDDELKIRTIYPRKRLLEASVRCFIDCMVEELGNAPTPLARIDTTRQR
ncbi:hypothetical protein FIV37_29280 [Pseudomonas gessardii]|nr:hypothetical protein [Pseudomonas gessardii]